MALKWTFSPNPGKQTWFMTAPQRTVGYGGSAGSGKALSPDHEVLCRRGWVPIADVLVGDEVLAWDQNVEHADGRTVYATVRGVYEQTQDTDFLEHDIRPFFRASPDHRWVTAWSPKPHQTNRWKTIRSTDLGHGMRIPAAGLPYEGDTENYRSEEMLLWGWFLAEGFEHLDRGRPTGRSVICQVNTEGRRALTDLFTRMGIRFRAHAQQFVIDWVPPLPCGLDCYSKFIPRELFRERHLNMLVAGLIAGDGSTDKRRKRYNWDFSTASRQLADDIQEAAAILGLRVFMAPRGKYYQSTSTRVIKNGKGRVKNATNWRIIASAQRNWTLAPGRLNWRHYKGKSYCLWVPGPGTFYARHKGAVFVTGNSDALLYHHCYLLDFENQRWRRGEINQSSGWCIYFRRVFPNLRQSIDRTLRTFPLIDPEAKWNAADHLWTYGCGLKYQFGGLEKTHDYLKYYGTEFQEIDFDELTEFEEEQFDQLDSRLRTSDPALKPFCNIRWGSNPVGEGLEWVRRRFVEPAPPGTVVRVPVKLDDGRVINQDQIFIQAYLSDNPWLAKDGQYEASLRRNKPHIYRALLRGDWYVSVGAFFSSFWDSSLHVVENHPIPPNVHRFRSCDFGIRAHTSITWWYVDADGCFTAYYNLHVKELTVDRVAERCREIEKYFGDWDPELQRSMIGRTSPLDAQCFKRSGLNYPTIAEEFRKYGLDWRPSMKDRKNGLAEVCRRLDGRVKVSEKREKPLIRWMRRCETPIKTIPTVPAHLTDPEEIKEGAWEDIVDELMYACLSRPLKPQKEAPPDIDWADDEDKLDEALRRTRSRRVIAGIRGLG